MFETLRKIERGLVRVETWALVVAVLAMLLLAAYNVVYRNALIPLQTSLRTSGPPVEAGTPPAGADEETAGADEADEADDEGGEATEDSEAGGFEGGFGTGGDSEGEKQTDDEPSFEGGFGSGGDSEPQEEAGDEPRFEGGFGGGGEESDESDESDEGTGDEPSFEGGFGAGHAQESDESRETDQEAGGFEGGFGTADETAGETAGEPDEDHGSAEGATESGGERAEPPAVTAPQPPKGGPPPEGSWAAWGIDVIDFLKLRWIDVFLRQMVLIVGFLGAMLATHRREHITIDAIGQLVHGRRRAAIDSVTSTFAVVICGFLAAGGLDLVEISRKYPEELLPWAQQWHFQLMFPVGFGLMAVHFALRAFETGWMAATGEGLEELREHEPVVEAELVGSGETEASEVSEGSRAGEHDSSEEGRA